MNSWHKGIVEWQDASKYYLSIVFTWHLPLAYQKCIWYGKLGYEVVVGGVAVKLMPDYLSSVAKIENEYENIISKHNQYATFTTRGCPNKCKFCAVPAIEGDFIELDTWEVKPIVCDNNFLASSRKHFDKVVDSLKFLKHIDFNQGLDARLLNNYHIDRLRELNIDTLRFSWDNINQEKYVFEAINRVIKSGIPKSKLTVYCLVNFNDTYDDARYRCEKLKSLGIMTFVMRYQPLNTLKKNSYVSPNWNGSLLTDFCRYWNRQVWLKKITFEDYIERRYKRKELR